MDYQTKQPMNEVMNEHPAVKWKDFVPWLRRQPRERAFEYGDIKNCMCCAFLRETQGIAEPSIGADYWRNEDLDYPERYDHNPIPEEVATALIMTRPLTCGKVLDQLEKKQ